MHAVSQPHLNPWFSILTRPSETIQQVVTADPKSKILLLAALSGCSQAIMLVERFAWWHRLSYDFLLAMIGIMILSVIFFHVIAVITYVTGIWIDTKASLEDVRAAIAWSYVPIIFAPLITLPLATVFVEYAHVGSGLIRAVAALWTLVILFKTLRQVHEFTLWKTLINILLSGLMLVVFLIIIYALVIMVVVLLFGPIRM